MNYQKPIGEVPLYYPEHKMIVVRHGTTALNDEGKLRGWIDVPLSDEGIADANIIANNLKSTPPDCIYTSDFERATKTAEIISKATGTPITGVLKGLRPWDIGDLTGTLVSEAHQILAEYAVYKPDEPLAGGESFNSFKKRFLDCIQEIDMGNKLTCIVTHHRCDRALEAWCNNGQPDDYCLDMSAMLQRGIPPGSFRTQIMKTKGKTY